VESKKIRERRRSSRHARCGVCVRPGGRSHLGPALFATNYPATVPTSRIDCYTRPSYLLSSWNSGARGWAFYQVFLARWTGAALADWDTPSALRICSSPPQWIKYLPRQTMEASKQFAAAFAGLVMSSERSRTLRTLSTCPIDETKCAGMHASAPRWQVTKALYESASVLRLVPHMPGTRGRRSG
jgi:hypothetical protein